MHFFKYFAVDQSETEPPQKSNTWMAKDKKDKAGPSTDSARLKRLWYKIKKGMDGKTLS